MIFFGSFFVFSSVIGFIKFTDVFRLMHVCGVCDLVGAPLMILGCGMIFLSNGDFHTFFKTFLISFILYIISPISTNALSDAAFRIKKLDKSVN